MSPEDKKVAKLIKEAKNIGTDAAGEVEIQMLAGLLQFDPQARPSADEVLRAMKKEEQGTDVLEMQKLVSMEEELASLRQQLVEMEEDHNAAVTAQEEGHEAALNALKAAFEAEKFGEEQAAATSATEASHASALADAKAALEKQAEENAAAIVEVEAESDKQRQNHAAALAAAVSEGGESAATLEAALSATKQELDSKLCAKEEEQATAVQALEETHRQALAGVESSISWSCLKPSPTQRSQRRRTWQK
jgi:hypothetical protein